MLHGINHIALPVRSLDVSDRFYRGILGLRAVGERPGMKFYTAGLHHHDLALMETGELFPVSGFSHFCLDTWRTNKVWPRFMPAAGPPGRGY